MSATPEAAIEEMAIDYAAYATIDMHHELRDVYDTVEEMQLRLEEFTSIMGMMQAQSDKAITENIPMFQALRPHVNNLCKRIDTLETFLAKANSDLTVLEASMEAAEATLGSGSKFNTLNPFTYFKKSPDTATNVPLQPTDQPPETFKMEDYFKTESQ